MNSSISGIHVPYTITDLIFWTCAILIFWASLKIHLAPHMNMYIFMTNILEALESESSIFRTKIDARNTVQIVFRPKVHFFLGGVFI